MSAAKTTWNQYTRMIFISLEVELFNNRSQDEIWKQNSERHEFPVKLFGFSRQENLSDQKMKIIYLMYI